jgi:hypothetical protein
MQKILSATGLFALVLWGCTALNGHVHAQNAHSNSLQQSATEYDTLTDASLKTALDDMGYEKKKLSNGYLLVIKQDAWVLNIQVLLSPDGRKVGLNSNLGRVADPNTVSAARWMDLLAANGDIDPSAFYFDREQQRLYLHRNFDNRAVTAAVLRREIEGFASSISKTEDLWKFTK